MGSGSSIRPSGTTEVVIPRWINIAYTKPEFLFDILSPLSSGFLSINSNTIVRACNGNSTIDIARWSRGFTGGRHIFEVAFSSHTSRTHASIGVGIQIAHDAMIGANDKTWGIHLDKRKSYHKGKCVRRYPASPNGIPDRFYMYIDLDKGCLEFGSDSMFYGSAIDGIDTRGSMLYPMVTASYTGAIVTMIYRGVGTVNVSCRKIILKAGGNLLSRMVVEARPREIDFSTAMKHQLPPVPKVCHVQTNIQMGWTGANPSGGGRWNITTKLVYLKTSSEMAFVTTVYYFVHEGEFPFVEYSSCASLLLSAFC